MILKVYLQAPYPARKKPKVFLSQARTRPEKPSPIYNSALRNYSFLFLYSKLDFTVLTFFEFEIAKISNKQFYYH